MSPTHPMLTNHISRHDSLVGCLGFYTHYIFQHQHGDYCPSVLSFAMGLLSPDDGAWLVCDDFMGPSVHTHSRLLLLCLLTGVDGQTSLSSSSEDSRLSPVCGDLGSALISVSESISVGDAVICSECVLRCREFAPLEDPRSTS